MTIPEVSMASEVVPVVGKTVVTSADKVPVSFYTRTSAYIVSDRPILLPVTSTPTDLSNLLLHLLESDLDADLPAPKFNFLFDSSLLLRGGLDQLLLEQGWTLERTVRLEYFEAFPEPKLESVVPHPEWIKSLKSVEGGNEGAFVSGCYDGKVRVFKRGQTGEAEVEFSVHDQVVNSIAVLPYTSDKSLLNARIISISSDQTSKSLSVTQKKTDFVTMSVGESLTALSTSRKGELMATGSFDGKIFVYSTRKENPEDNFDEIAASGKSKKSKKSTVSVPETPKRTARVSFEAAHSASITSLIFDSSDVNCRFLYSASLDNTIKGWDLHEQSHSFIISTDFPITCMTQSPHNPKHLLTGHPDGSVRLWDLTSVLISSSALQVSTFFSSNPDILIKKFTACHEGWISAVAFSPDSEFTFATCGFDGRCCLWDTRASGKMEAQSTLIGGHVDESGLPMKLLALDWSNTTGLLRVGGEDCQVSCFSTR